MSNGWKLGWIIAGAIAVGAVACGPPTDEAWDEPYEVSGPVETGDQMIFLNESLEKLHIVEAEKSGGEVGVTSQKVPTGSDPARMARSADGERLFLLNRGDQTLGVYDLTEERPEPEIVELESPFDRVTVDPQGEFVLLSYSKNPEGCTACVPQEVGVVDLRDGVPESVGYETLDKRVLDFEFASTFSAAGGEQRLVAALAPSKVMILDLQALTSEDANEDDEVRNVDLTVSEADPVRQPDDAVFHVRSNEEGDDSVTLYVSTENGNDVTQISIQPSARSDAPRKFDLSINQLAVGQSPSAIAVLDLPDAGTRLLTLDSSDIGFQLVDVQSGEGNSFDLPIQSAPDDLLVYRTIVQNEDGTEETETRVLVWSNTSSVVAVLRPASIAISDETPTVGRSIRAIRLDAPPASMRMERGGDRTRAIAVHSGTRSGFSVLNLRAGENSATSVVGNSLADVEFTGSSAWGVFQGTAEFGRFELEDGHPTTFDLPNEGRNLLIDGEAGAVLVDHGKSHGEFTVLDADEPSPENARVVQGVFVDGLFQESFPESD